MRVSNEPQPAPGPGRVIVFSDIDAVGAIELASGETLRFGRSACRGFIPTVGLPIDVLSIGPHPLGGFRATAVQLPDDARAQADAELDLRHPSPAEDALSVAHTFGVLTLLLRDPTDGSRGQVRALFDRAGLAELGAQLDDATLRVVQRGGTQLRFAIGREPYPRELLDVRHAPECELGVAYLVFEGVVPALTAGIAGDAPNPDLWQPGGTLQLMTQLSRRFLAHGLATAVLLHRAGEVVRTPTEWLRTTQSCDEPDHRAFLPWLDLGGKHGVLRSYGMSAMWLPDVEVSLARPGVDDAEAYRRSHEAIQYACHRLVHRDDELRDGTHLYVPVAVQVDAGPLELLNEELDRTPVLDYVVVAEGERRRLVPQGTWPLASYWRQADQGGIPLAFPIYRELMLAALASSGHYVASMSFPEQGDVPLHEVLVFERHDGQFLLITCGLARLPQEGGEAANDDRRIEMLLVLPTHAPEIATLLSLLGAVIHARPPGSPPIGPEHRVGLPHEHGRFRMGSFMVGWAGKLDLGAEPLLSLYAPVAMTPEETAGIRGDARVKWLHTVGATPEVRNRWLGVIG